MESGGVGERDIDFGCPLLTTAPPRDGVEGRHSSERLQAPRFGENDQPRHDPLRGTDHEIPGLSARSGRPVPGRLHRADPGELGSWRSDPVVRHRPRDYQRRPERVLHGSGTRTEPTAPVPDRHMPERLRRRFEHRSRPVHRAAYVRKLSGTRAWRRCPNFPRGRSPSPMRSSPSARRWRSSTAAARFPPGSCGTTWTSRNPVGTPATAWCSAPSAPSTAPSCRPPQPGR